MTHRDWLAGVLLQKLWEGLARQRHLELKAKREKEAKSISRIAQRRVEALGGTEDDKRIVAESSQALKTSVAVGTTVAETAMEFHPVVAVSNVVNGRDLNGNKLSVGERAWEAATAIPAAINVAITFLFIKVSSFYFIPSGDLSCVFRFISLSYPLSRYQE